MIIKFYEKILNPIFLIKYGYYDYEIKKEQMNDELYGQSPTLFYNIFNMDDFALFLTKYGDNVELLKNDLKLDYYTKKNTVPVSFSIPKDNVARRQLKFPNIYSYTILAYYINENKKEFFNVFAKNKNSISKYFNQLGYKYKKTEKIRYKLLFNGKKCLYIDLSNFYHTLYTHSIPWVIMGKDKAKKERNKGFSNRLDKLIQRSQDGETYGIPTGNMVSRIVAELYMCYIDNELNQLESKYTYSRYVDDIIFPFNYDEERISFYQDFQQICDKYNLKINEKKTKIEEFPYIDINNKSKLFTFLENLNDNKKNYVWINEFLSFIDFCLLNEVKGNKGSIKIIFTSIYFKIKDSKKSEKDIDKIFTRYDNFANFNLYEKILDISLLDSKLTNYFIEFTKNIISKGVDKYKLDLIVEKYFESNKFKIKNQINDYNENFKNQELYQLLLYCVFFNNKKLFIVEELLNLINPNTDDFSLVLIFILIYRNQNKEKINEALRKFDQLFFENHKNYPNNYVRLQESFWFVRYFIYSAIDYKIIDIDDYFISYKIKKDLKNGFYISELNWEYIKSLNPENPINIFYAKLLTEKVKFVSFGDKNDFKYYI